MRDRTDCLDCKKIVGRDKEHASQHEKRIAAPRGGGERVKAQSDFSPSATAESYIDTLKAVLRACLQLLGGDGGGFHVAKGIKAQAGSWRLHDQADNRGFGESVAFEA